MSDYNERVDGDVMPVSDFLESCESGCLIDYDGFGHPARGGKMDGKIYVYPSSRDEIPEDATHIVWYNK